MQWVAEGLRSATDKVQLMTEPFLSDAGRFSDGEGRLRGAIDE
ncbi:MAG: hypothetical protein WBC73_19795 [Phormidesmis sp.]